PNMTRSDHLDENQRYSPRIVKHRGREYAVDQVGYFTLSDDGFGVDTLVYCHDLYLEFPKNSSLQHGRPNLLWRVFGVLIQASASVVDTLGEVLSAPWGFLRSSRGQGRDGDYEDHDQLD
ncbi:hypothetical protein BGZ65_005095, partial [Modicella reniformis]